MVGNITSLTNNGLRDFLIQRVTAIILAVYTFVLLYYFSQNPHLDYAQWHTFFSYQTVQVGTFLTVLSLILHAWIGFWTVTTDYLPKLMIRLPVQMLVIVLLVACLIWTAMILWGG